MSHGIKRGNQHYETGDGHDMLQHFTAFTLLEGETGTLPSIPSYSRDDNARTPPLRLRQGTASVTHLTPNQDNNI